MLELRLVQATLLKNVLEALSVSDLFSEANFEFSGTGLELQAMDTSRVALVALLLRADAFNHYRCDSDLSMGLNLADMAKVFRCANNDDILTIKTEDGWPDSVIFMFESPTHRVRANERVDFFTRGKAGTSTIFCTVGKSKEPILIEMKEKVSLTFDLRYVNSFSKVSTLSDQVTISLSSELPAVFEYKIVEMGYIRYYMMPRIEMQNEGDEMQNEGDEMQN